MADIANPINPEGDVLDYEAEEPDEEHHEPVQQTNESMVADAEPIEDDENVGDQKPDADDDDDEGAESLEEGEVSDEDEESRKERLKPQPVCRFYSKGQCTWGSSCRFVHPGVLDKGNYNMFAPPRPILPAEQEPIEKVIEEEKLKSPEEPTPTVRRPETAWERGLRQAREMKKLSQQRKETDIEYDEKRTNLTLTQAELDRENDYYMRPASPIHDNSEEEDFAEDVPRLRRIAPPPPPEFQSRPARRYPSPPNRRFDRSPSPPSSRVRRVAPPRSPPGPGGPRHRRGDEWADPWMRDNAEQGSRRSRPRKRSYSSGSSRSSSRSSSSRSRSRSPKRRRRRRSSSGSSKSSRSRNRSRSRSSTPEGIPRRNNREDDSPVNRNTAPLQKRLMSLASTSNPAKMNIKKEPEDKKANLSAADAALAKSNRSRKSSKSSSASSRSSSRSSSPSSSRRRKSNSQANNDQPKELSTEIAPSTPPPEMADSAQDDSAISAAPKPQIKMAFKPSAVSKTTNKNVLEKLGNDTSEILENAKAKREENKLKKAGEIKKEKKEKKKSTADRREELLKQLKAVENAIAKKRTKINEKV